MTITIILLNIGAFIYELSLGSALLPFIEQFGIVPARVLSWPGAHVPAGAALLPFMTSIFLHGGWMHLIGNMWYLWIFGDNVEDRLGHFKFLIFYIVCGIGASLAHIVLNAGSDIPSIGASGAIAGVLGAYLVSYPFARVLTLIPLFIFIEFIEVPALIVLGLWFAVQLLSGTAAITSSSVAASAGVAWWAHIGGFIIGIVVLYALRPQPVRPSLARYRS